MTDKTAQQRTIILVLVVGREARPGNVATVPRNPAPRRPPRLQGTVAVYACCCLNALLPQCDTTRQGVCALPLVPAEHAASLNNLQTRVICDSGLKVLFCPVSPPTCGTLPGGDGGGIGAELSYITSSSSEDASCCRGRFWCCGKLRRCGNDCLGFGAASCYSQQYRGQQQGNANVLAQAGSFTRW